MQIEVKGLDTLIKKMDKLAKDVQKDVQAELNAWADDTATMAISLVAANSSDEGLLKNSIKPKYGNGNASVVAATKYAAYIEFGTRKFASAYVGTLPADWATYANTFKGSVGGTFDDLLLSIMLWVGRKGIDKDAAYPIARKIMIDGIRPKPYLYPSV
ncbi:MAG: HK97 gp10 family phage protein, partial [Caulobacteraceae bacterium]|nr:HK97 gp10 family phage protein [Caulobacteraceae bacterium]